MSMFQKTSMLSRPEEGETILPGDFAYFRARNKNRAYELVLCEFIDSKISQAELARRTGKRPEVICRLLGSPGNWTLDTLSDLLLAISGAEPAYSIRRPFDEPAKNFRQPEWLPEYRAKPGEVIRPQGTPSQTRPNLKDFHRYEHT